MTTIDSLRKIAQALEAEGQLLITKAWDLMGIIEQLDESKAGSITAYSQNDPRWAGQVCAGGTTFATAGCYVTCVSMVATYAGYADDPPETARKLREAQCFHENMLSYPQRIPAAYPDLEWPAGAYWNRTGERIDEVKWEAIKTMILFDGPLILKVDYRPENYKFNMHFVLAVNVIDDDDLQIIDPIDGQYSSLLERYGKTRGWSARQAIFGYRGLRLRK